MKTGKLTFGLFQRPAKLGPQVWDGVAEILRGCKGSVLLIHQGSRDLDVPGSRAQRRCIDALEGRGISRDRLIFRGTLPPAGHLELLAEADIALDTFPYNGVTTTYECLWMGVPVVTLTGESHGGRMGFAILQKIGLEALAATSVEQYVSMALSLAGDHHQLDNLRRGLRAKMRQSDLAQPLRTTRGIEKAYREIWRDWCSAQTACGRTLQTVL
jgi:predicted O-linked N-acetylglucosamine transferase (SPINDLY family)